MNDQLEKTVFGDLAQLEKSLADDSTGDRARQIISYFTEVTQAAEAMLATAGIAERQLVAQLIEGFRAAKRIVASVWETLHSASLAV